LRKIGCKKDVINTHKIFILGNQKSGTTAIGWLIAHYGDLTKTLDIPELWKEERKIFSGKRALASFVRSHRQIFSTELIKEPCLTFLYRELAEIFPESQFVFIIRHPADNIRSILDRLEVPGYLESAELQIKTRNTWKDVFYGTFLGSPEQHYIARLAKRWVLAAEIYLKNRDKMLLIRYEDFLEDKLKCIQAVSQQLGINAKNDIRSNLDVQYQSRGKTRDLPWIKCYGEKNIAIIRKICSPYLQYFNYTLPQKRRVHVYNDPVANDWKTMKKLDNVANIFGVQK
jgi:hypothetical protein